MSQPPPTARQSCQCGLSGSRSNGLRAAASSGASSVLVNASGSEIASPVNFRESPGRQTSTPQFSMEPKSSSLVGSMLTCWRVGTLLVTRLKNKTWHRVYQASANSLRDAPCLETSLPQTLSRSSSRGYQLFAVYFSRVPNPPQKKKRERRALLGDLVVACPCWFRIGNRPSVDLEFLKHRAPPRKHQGIPLDST